jgi:phosphoribosylglycinamide formyltransferase-1
MSTTLGILASGRGSNAEAIQRAIDAGTLDARIAVLITDREQAPVRDFARQHGITEHYIPYDRKNRAAFEQEAIDLLKEAGCDLVILAGFMRLLTPLLINTYADRMLNIHPSLLPSFKGLDAQKQALDYGVKIAGCTVHLVTEEMDSGPILGQRAVPVLSDDTDDTLSARILEQEHQLFSECIGQYSTSIKG